MTRGSNKGTKPTEYQRFKNNEQKYIKTRVHGYEPKPKKRKDWIWWLVAVVVLSTSIYFVVDHMVDSRDAVYDSAQIARLSAREAVEQMFDEDENGELSYIRRDLTLDEYNQIKEMVDEVPESSEKVQINSLMREAGEQTESQGEAIGLIEGLKTPSGEPNVDLTKKDLLEDMSEFPSNFNPEYVNELEQEYVELANVITDANDLQERIRELAVNEDGYLDKDELDSLDTQVEDLPFSDRKSQLTYDMKALYQTYERQQVELEKKREEEEARRAEQERYRQEQEEIRRKEAEKRAEEEAREQAIIEQQLEKERQEQAERDRIEREERERIEREERERIEREEREQEEREAQQRAEEEARLEQERLEEESRLEQERQERERIEQEEQQRTEEEERLQQEQQQQGEDNGQ